MQFLISMLIIWLDTCFSLYEHITMWFFEAKGDDMERYTELLYWLDFSQYIHYNEEDDTYYYDEELPERARKSFEAWKEQAEDWGVNHDFERSSSTKNESDNRD